MCGPCSVPLCLFPPVCWALPGRWVCPPNRPRCPNQPPFLPPSFLRFLPSFLPSSAAGFTGASSTGPPPPGWVGFHTPHPAHIYNIHIRIHRPSDTPPPIVLCCVARALSIPLYSRPPCLPARLPSFIHSGSCNIRPPEPTRPPHTPTAYAHRTRPPRTPSPPTPHRSQRLGATLALSPSLPLSRPQP